jgi:flagella basal body P-ring formation protein FlgA
MIVLLMAVAGMVAGQGAAPGRSCLPVSGDRITMRDFVPAIPEFAAAPPDALVAYAPLPGAHRLFSAAEVQRISIRHQLALTAPTAVCFEPSTEELLPEPVLASMRKSLGIPGARIEIVELSRIPVPPGELEFPLNSLVRPAGTATQSALWRGYVHSGASRRFPVWARVNIRAPLRRVVTVADLPSGVPIGPEALRVEEYEGFPALRQPLQELEQAVGRLPRRIISAGSAVFEDSIVAPPAVGRGEPVEVTSRSGAAKLSLSATAETAGRIGETISVRNNDSRKAFPVRVTGKGKAAVIMMLQEGPAEGRKP